MSHPRPNHLYSVMMGEEFQGNFAWAPGPPPTYTLWGSDNEVIYTGPYEPDPPLSKLVNGTTGLSCGYVNNSASPDSAILWCDCWPRGQERTLRH